MKDFKQYYIINELPSIVYKALTTQHTLQLITGAKVIFEPNIGIEFSLYNQDINGVNLFFQENEEIIQQFFLHEIYKPEDASIVSYKFFKNKKGTSLLVEQNNIPETQYAEVQQFWNSIFMKDLIDFYKN